MNHISGIALTTVISLLVAFILVLRNLGDRRLDRFPGPALARWTLLYRFYYDIIRGGGWVEHLQKLHEIYGPIIRVGPNELHFSRPEAYSEIYAVGSKFAKDPWSYPQKTTFHVFGIYDANEAMARRAIILPYLSKRSISEREWIIQREVDRFINDVLNNTSPIHVKETARSFLGVIIPSVCFPELHSNTALSTTGVLSAVTNAPKSRFPFLLFKYIPQKWTLIIRRWFLSLKSRNQPYSRMNEGKAYAIMAQQALSTPVSEIPDDNANIMSNLLARSVNQVVPEPKSQWLVAESLNLKYAGMDTMSTAILIIIRGVLANEVVRLKLIGELNDAWPDMGTALCFAALEKLSYLTAVIKEGLRLSVGIFSPMNRVVGPGNATISGESIPEGTVVGMAHSMIHFNPDIFPDPQAFRPERWLQEDGQQLDKYLMSFGRGPRSCVGIHLAWSTLYLLIANVFRRLDLSPTSVDDMRAPYRLKDNFVAVYDGKPIYVRAKFKEG
ncbi:benzoate 4-monooxygenase cytochrome p450 [Moniliophthora roreri MCA 2997]|uniref:Benzoate 4-monooxygenase cytochrome p450 n=1 Tax=Moniliophthora roreri (strain MCA 2997) TaxID=1381753 RepID=V2XQV4_MONRO|nr:benzoate 4-monooxygenase cytochrome p450 [Moniliophthora roreri MCA 2997]KAI3619639.1 benzoate 4-monooxygenase cytochrome p450 [Moniliophthora roreri]